LKFVDIAIQNFYRFPSELGPEKNGLIIRCIQETMHLDKETLLKGIEQYVRAIFANGDTSKLVYHNFGHTSGVAKHAREMATYYELSADEYFVVIASAWFHDTGHLYGELERHEEKSADIANFYLYDKGCTDDMLEAVKQCILATKMPVRPVNLLEQILCDADTYQLGTPDFFQKNELVWDELELRLGKKITHRITKSIDFLEAHQYFTGYCKQLLLPGKLENLARLKSVL
jgi:predicted metal-dependent HD superfamily phosphohydrolase